MKILFLGEPSSPNTMSWVEGLCEQGCEVVLASARTDGSDGNIPIGNPKLTPRLRILTATGQLKKIIAREKPDILLAYRITSYGYLAARTGFHPLVLAAQNEQIIYLPHPSRIRRRMIEQFVRYALNKADLIHSWGENITNGLLKYGADGRKILTLHRGIDIDILKEKLAVQKKRQFNKDAPIFISTRSLYPEYMLDKILRAFYFLIKKLPDSRLELIGSGSEKESLLKLTEELGLEKSVTFHGKLPKDKLTEVLLESNIYISIIQSEGISSSLLEAIACEVMPIVADIPSSRSLIEDKINGFLIGDLQPEELAETMGDAVNYFPSLGENLKTNSLDVAFHYDRTRNQKFFKENYENLICPDRVSQIVVKNGMNKNRNIIMVNHLKSNSDYLYYDMQLVIKLASMMPDRAFYVLGTQEKDVDCSLLYQLPNNCLFMSCDFDREFNWALQNAGIYFHHTLRDYSTQYLKFARQAGLSLIGPSEIAFSNSEYENTGLEFSSGNLCKTIKGCCN